MSTQAIAAVALDAPRILEPSLQPLFKATELSNDVLVGMQGGFGDLVTQGLKQVNQQLMSSQTDLQQLAVGNVENLHQIMIRLEESRLSFQLVMQVRNRLLEAYQDVMKMQV